MSNKVTKRYTTLVKNSLALQLNNTSYWIRRNNIRVKRNGQITSTSDENEFKNISLKEVYIILLKYNPHKYEDEIHTINGGNWLIQASTSNQYTVDQLRKAREFLEESKSIMDDLDITFEIEPDYVEYLKLKDSFMCGLKSEYDKRLDLEPNKKNTFLESNVNKWNIWTLAAEYDDKFGKYGVKILQYEAVKSRSTASKSKKRKENLPRLNFISPVPRKRLRLEEPTPLSSNNNINNIRYDNNNDYINNDYNNDSFDTQYLPVDSDFNVLPPNWPIDNNNNNNISNIRYNNNNNNSNNITYDNNDNNNNNNSNNSNNIRYDNNDNNNNNSNNNSNNNNGNNDDIIKLKKTIYSLRSNLCRTKKEKKEFGVEIEHLNNLIRKQTQSAKTAKLLQNTLQFKNDAERIKKIKEIMKSAMNVDNMNIFLYNAVKDNYILLDKLWKSVFRDKKTKELNKALKKQCTDPETALRNGVAQCLCKISNKKFKQVKEILSKQTQINGKTIKIEAGI